MEDLPIRRGVTIPSSDLSWTSVAASGPGGQHVNKVATKVLLRFDMDKCEVLPEGVKRRLREQVAHCTDGEGRILLTCQATRSRARNLEIARAKLADLIRGAWQGPKKRRRTRVPRGAIERRLAGKRRRSQAKQDRRRVPRDD
jgi:ribosome-associated protein